MVLIYHKIANFANKKTPSTLVHHTFKRSMFL